MVSVGNSLLWNRIHTGNIPDHRKLPFQDQDEEKPARHSIGMRFLSSSLQAQVRKDTTQAGHNYEIDDVVVTGTRNETDIRHLPMTISVVNRETIGQRSEPSLLPTLTEQVPGLFTTSRGVMGYGVSNGAAGGISLRGIGGSPTTGLLVLIDGHPQYMGLMGHPIADAYQSMLAEKVEVVRGPASVLYGSNAMGGVINIVTRRQREDGVRTGVRLGYGSYDTWMTEATNQVKKDVSTALSPDLITGQTVIVPIWNLSNMGDIRGWVMNWITAGTYRPI